MARTIDRTALLLGALTLVVAACGGDSGSTTTTTTLPDGTPETTAPSDPGGATTTNPAEDGETTTTGAGADTTTTGPTGPVLISEGDRNETVAAFQFLINCNGYGDLTVDGAFGPATLAALQAAQTRTGQSAPDDEMLAALSRSCNEQRRIEGDEAVTMVGNAAPEDPEEFAVALRTGSTLTANLTKGVGITVKLLAPDGTEIEAGDDGIWAVDTSGDYVIEVGAPTNPGTFTLVVNVSEGVQEEGDWLLATTGLAYKGTWLNLGDPASTVIDEVFEHLGHGVRGAYEEFDTGWYTITDPQDMGLRGIFIEGFALLFYGPDPNNPDRAETFARHRFVGPSDDGDGNPRPANYATTAEGITVGHTLTDLLAAYGGSVTAGSNSQEHYYRYATTGGELCFYFGASAPTDYSPILEIASECRS